MPGPIISWHLLGVREFSGRFASLRNGGAAAIMEERAGVLTEEVARLLREAAPFRGADPNKSTPFRDSFKAEVLPAPMGFEAGVRTEQPDLREWLKHGTGTRGDGKYVGKSGGAIEARNAGFMAWSAGAGPFPGSFLFKVVQGQAPNPWEDKVRPEAEAMAIEGGRKMAQRIMLGLSGRA